MNRLSVPLAWVALLGLGGVLAADEMQLTHMVFFTLAEDTPEHRAQLVAACKKHLSRHEGTVYFSAGSIADDLRREVNDLDFDVALHLVFANKQAHDEYQTHPRHLQFITENKQLWSRVRVFDSYVIAPPTRRRLEEAVDDR